MFKVRSPDKVRLFRLLLIQFPVVEKFKVPEFVRAAMLLLVKALFTVKIVLVFTSKLAFKILKSLFKLTLAEFVIVN